LKAAGMPATSSGTADSGAMLTQPLVTAVIANSDNVTLWNRFLKTASVIESAGTLPSINNMSGRIMNVNVSFERHRSFCE
ncbi:MAG: hypothetical protein ABJ237_13555, partial [Parasphingorhabdus sp.]|uniref:hypothetical protein n=1 Tax=Parasphingorhabdus sp. TaxID=2709688 RepID=UPI003298D672